MQPKTAISVKVLVNSLPSGGKRAPWQAIFSIVMMLFYDASPIDLIPDVLPIIGYFDDAVVSVLLTLFAFFSWRKWHKAKRAAQRANLPAV